MSGNKLGEKWLHQTKNKIEACVNQTKYKLPMSEYFTYLI
jgi:hypothetical protein